VRLNSLEIFLTGSFSREYCFNNFRSPFVHSFRVRFVLLTIITPWLFRLLHNAHIVAVYKFAHLFAQFLGHCIRCASVARDKHGRERLTRRSARAAWFLASELVHSAWGTSW
jgi:hypothetical protein